MSVIVLGGGIGGLSASLYLSTLSKVTNIKLIEASSRFGGWIKTDQRDGYRFECGPRTIRPRGLPGMAGLDLIQDVGLADKILPIKSDHVAARNRMVYAKNQVCLLPNSLGGVFKTIPPFTKPLFIAGLRDIFGRKSKVPLSDESIYDFAARRFGQEIADYAIGPVICGICAGDAKEVSVKFILKELFEKEQKYGSAIRGVLIDQWKGNRAKPFVWSELFKRAAYEKWALYSLEGGIESIPRAIVQKLSANDSVSLQLNSPCDSINFESNRVDVTVNGKIESTEHLVSSLPSFKLATLMQHQHPELADELKMIKCNDVAVINLQYSADNLLETKGFGVLVPPIENIPILGIIFDSCCFDMNGKTVLTVMMGGKWFEKWFGANPTKEELLEITLKNIKTILKIEQKPDDYQINIQRQCIPQYVIGHHDRVQRIRSYIDAKKLPLSLCGASYDGVGVNDVILCSKNAINDISQFK